MRFSKDGKALVVVNDKEIKLWDIAQRKIIHTIPDVYDPLDGVSCVDISPDGSMVVVLRNSGLRIYDIATGVKRSLLTDYFEVTRFPGGWGTKGARSTWSFSISPDGNVIAAWGSYGIKFFDMWHDLKFLRAALSWLGVQVESVGLFL